MGKPRQKRSTHCFLLKQLKRTCDNACYDFEIQCWNSLPTSTTFEHCKYIYKALHATKSPCLFHHKNDVLDLSKIQTNWRVSLAVGSNRSLIPSLLISRNVLFPVCVYRQNLVLNGRLLAAYRSRPSRFIIFLSLRRSLFKPQKPHKFVEPISNLQ